MDLCGLFMVEGGVGFVAEGGDRAGVKVGVEKTERGRYLAFLAAELLAVGIAGDPSDPLLSFSHGKERGEGACVQRERNTMRNGGRFEEWGVWGREYGGGGVCMRSMGDGKEGRAIPWWWRCGSGEGAVALRASVAR
ncbi:unnamed protein product [Ilex paraguariensis]|uniref:Uncharacterized protein n=1 Tax=Ilex paraguariensis TaxID=185542 RepID=A0ABC8UR93_9AQUA